MVILEIVIGFKIATGIHYNFASGWTRVTSNGKYVNFLKNHDANKYQIRALGWVRQHDYKKEFQAIECYMT